MFARTSVGQRGPLPDPAPTRVAAAETPRVTLTSPLVFAAVVIAGLYFGREIFIPIAIALLLSFVLGPLVQLLRRLRLPRLPAVTLTVLTALGVAAALTVLIGVQLADLAGDVPRYRDTIERKVEGLRQSPAGHALAYVANIGRAIHSAGIVGPGPARDAAEPVDREKPEPIPVEMKPVQPGPLEMAGALLSPALQPLATAGIVFVVLLFVLMQREDLRDRLIRLAGSSDLHRTTVAMDDAARRLSRYFLVQLAVNTGFGLIIGVGLYLIGVPNPVLWAIFTAAMRFVPYVGAFLSALLPMALAAAVDPGWDMLIATTILFLVLEPITGQIVEPTLYGQSTGLSPFAVLVSALFWTWLWGPLGLLLSTPLTVCLVVLGRHVEKLEFLDVLFGDRPALTPVENFYQRILADDPEEAQEHADLILRDQALSAYYDEVVLKGLELAARDAARGVLSIAQKNAIRATLGELVEELDGCDDRPPDSGTDLFERGADEVEGSRAWLEPSIEAVPPAWSREGAVLCVAGRGFLDESVCAILAQLLRKRGLGVRLVPFPDLARARIDAFDPDPARIAFVVSLAIDGEPPHLRRLVGRLKGRMPAAPVLVGLWQADDVADDVAEGAPGSSGIAADGHVSSLRAAVEAALEAVRADAAPVAAGLRASTAPVPAGA